MFFVVFYNKKFHNYFKTEKKKKREYVYYVIDISKTKKLLYSSMNPLNGLSFESPG